MTTKYWIINGGDWDGSWENVIIAKDAAEALSKFKEYRTQAHLNCERERMTKAKEFGAQYTPYPQHQETVGVWAAEENQYGLIEISGEEPVIWNVLA